MSQNEEIPPTQNYAATEADPDDESGAFETDSVTLSFVTDGPRICFAAYNDDSREIWIEECMANGFEVRAMVERAILQLQPTLILVSSKIVANEDLLKLLTTLSEGTNEDQESTVPTAADGTENKGQRLIPYQALKSSSFDVQSCKALILQKLMVESITRHRQGPVRRDPERNFRDNGILPPSFAVSRYHALASVIDLESTVQIQALGSLLSFLSKTFFPTSEGGLIAVSDIVRGNMSLYMSVPQATLSALHIFSTERHPLLAAKGTGNAKEGFSLFSMLDSTKSRGGRQRLREWMMKPLVDLDAIKQRQDGIELFLLPDFQDAVGTLLKLLERVGPVENIIKRIEKCVAQPNDFFVLTRSLRTALQICETLHEDILWRLQNAQQDEQSHQYIQFVLDLLHGSALTSVHNLLETLVAATDESVTEVWGATALIRDGFCEELDAMRETFANLEIILEDVCTDLAQQIPHLSSIMNLVFFPQVGFLVRLVEDDRLSAEEHIPEEFEFVYADSGFAYFKDPVARDLDMQYGDPDSLIKDREALLVAKLEEDILDCRIELRQIFSALADLDCILSFAVRASDYGYVRPQIVPADENSILIRNGRHPLQEMHLGKDFIPNDTSMDIQNQVNIITGPNFSGKSCYARQVGVLVYMAHIGCYLPCDAARISIIREILVRFSAVETCSVPQSTFQLDLSQMGNILRLAGPGSLVLIDEFGKGTSPASGIGLLAAAIKTLVQSRAKVVCTTHFVEVFSMGMLLDGQEGIKALRMSVKVPQRKCDLAIPLFKLEDGVADSSASLVCAKMAGLNQAIVDRAGEIIQASQEGKHILPLEEIFRQNLPFTEPERDLLRRFLQKDDWSEATDDEISDLLEAIHHVRGTK